MNSDEKIRTIQAAIRLVTAVKDVADQLHALRSENAMLRKRVLELTQENQDMIRWGTDGGNTKNT